MAARPKPKALLTPLARPGIHAPTRPDATNIRRNAMPLPRMRIFHQGKWHDGPINLMGPHHHAFWLASSVFDGARAFEGVLPDIDRHCERVNQSAKRLFLKP